MPKQKAQGIWERFQTHTQKKDIHLVISVFSITSASEFHKCITTFRRSFERTGSLEVIEKARQRIILSTMTRRMQWVNR